MGSDNLRPVVNAWVNKIQQAFNHKKSEFQDDADEAMSFFNGPYDFLYNWKQAIAKGSFSYAGNDDDLPVPSFRMTINKVAELVQIFGPALYHKNPIRKVNPRKLPMLPISMFGNGADPVTQQLYQTMAMQVEQQSGVDNARASLLEQYLNYTPTALDLKTESRQAIDEALIKGCGCLWTELYYPAGAGGMKMAGSFYDTVDNLLIDPDMESLQAAGWIAKRCVAPYWKVEREYQLPPDTLRRKASMESYGQQAGVASVQDGDYRRRQGVTNDLVVYWKIWSKVGIGGRLSGLDSGLRDQLEIYGDYVFLVICETCPFPLNIPEQFADAMLDDDLLTQAAAVEPVKQMVQWPVPYWADDSWPVTQIAFHQIPRKVWPMSHIKPAMGELKFLNWAFSMLAGKIRTASRDFIAIAKSAGEELKDRIKTGPDYTILEVENLHGNIDNVVKFLQHPVFNGEIYKIIEAVMENFEKRTGLTELAYGATAHQLRSAQEADVKRDFANLRPDDMANKVEDAMSEVARKEALLCRWHISPQDVAPVLGQIGANWWQQFITASDPVEVLHQLEYRIEAGSTKKPNKQLDQTNMQTSLQTFLPLLWQYAQATGNVGPFNGLVTGWAKSIDLDPSAFLLPTPPPPQPGPGGPPQQKPPGKAA